MAGRAGNVGSHTCVELLSARHELVVFDIFCSTHPEALAGVEKSTGRKLNIVR